MILLIDNYDSFTFNLYQIISTLGFEVKVVRNDEISVAEIVKLKPSHIVISPGPGRPREAGITLSTIATFSNHIPILGICLGHQAIGEAFGGQVIRARRPQHGKHSNIQHNGKGSFAGIKNPLSVVRYHSLVVEKENLPECLEVTSLTEDGLIMSLRHRHLPIEGFQFHPESIATEFGSELLQGFFKRVGGL